MKKDLEDVKKALKFVVTDGRISCTAARELAAELGVSIQEVGQAADELKIKIFACELGCF